MRRTWNGILFTALTGVALATMVACGDGSVAPPQVAASASPTPSPGVTPQVLPVPGLAIGPLETPSDPDLVILSRSLDQDIAQWWRLDGRLANVGDTPARNARITVRFYDASGVLVDTKQALVVPEIIYPGLEAHYSLIWPPDPRVYLVTLQPAWNVLGN